MAKRQLIGKLWRQAYRAGNYSSFVMRLFPEMRVAHNAVSAAKARGDMPKASELECVDCGDQALHYDHRDYRKPLDVDPVCRRCNYKRGRAEPYKDRSDAAILELFRQYQIREMSSHRDAQAPS